MSTEEILDDADYFTWVFLPALFKVIKCSTEDLSHKNCSTNYLCTAQQSEHSPKLPYLV